MENLTKQKKNCHYENQFNLIDRLDVVSIRCDGDDSSGFN